MERSTREICKLSVDRLRVQGVLIREVSKKQTLLFE